MLGAIGGVTLFHTGWFVESLMTQTLIIHVIRTRQIPFIQARASTALTITTVIIMAISAWLPFSPLATMLGLVPLPWLFWPILFATLICYVVLTWNWLAMFLVQQEMALRCLLENAIWARGAPPGQGWRRIQYRQSRFGKILSDCSICDSHCSSICVVINCRCSSRKRNR